jgi:hypothetical protein
MEEAVEARGGSELCSLIHTTAHGIKKTGCPMRHINYIANIEISIPVLNARLVASGSWFTK